MEIKKLGRSECLEVWGDGRCLPTVKPEQLSIDEKIIRGKCKETLSNYGGLDVYQLDVAFALDLYFDILSLETGFSLRVAADDGIWRRLSVMVLPDIVSTRWGLTSEGVFPSDHFWLKSQRIWLKCLWWYCHLSRQETRQDTRNVLLAGSTDAIQAIVERPGDGGFRVELCREIMGRLVTEGFSVEKLKRVMKLNTTRVNLIEPAFFSGGIPGYVDSLIRGLGDAQ
jgi:hypothetical protein